MKVKAFLGEPWTGFMTVEKTLRGMWAVLMSAGSAYGLGQAGTSWGPAHCG